MALKSFVLPAEGQAEAAKGPKSKFRLLYIEDETLNWEVTLLHLQERYDLTRAVDSREAFAELSTKSFHAILMDIQLQKSDLNGIEITQVLRGTFKGIKPEYTRGVSLPDIPIIFMSAYSARYSKEELVGVGGDDLIAKPINFTTLSLVLSRAVLKSFKA